MGTDPPRPAVIRDDGRPTDRAGRLRRMPDRLEEVEALERPAATVAGAIRRVLPPGPLKDVLSGTPLGHAVHPPLTDLPIGFWTSAWALDIVGGRPSRDAARRLVGLGVLSAVPAALTGASDWGDTAGGPRRVGLVHAAANSAALVCYSTSWIQRRRGRHTSGVAWGWAGAAAATVGGYLGGHLINALGIGVDHTAFDDGARDWTAAAERRGGAGPARVVDAGGVAVLVVDQGGARSALADRCTHRGGPLHDGEVHDGCVTCPWHGSVFRLADGEVERGPAARPQPRYEVRGAGGALEVRRAGRRPAAYAPTS